MTAPTYLRELWPLYLLAQAGEPEPGSINLNDLMVPPQTDQFRARLTPILNGTNPTAAHALASMPDKELELWILALREAQLTGDLMLTPAWLTRNGIMLTGLARVVALPFFERMDVFLHALHTRGRAA